MDLYFVLFHIDSRSTYIWRDYDVVLRTTASVLVSRFGFYLAKVIQNDFQIQSFLLSDRYPEYFYNEAWKYSVSYV